MARKKPKNKLPTYDLPNTNVGARTDSGKTPGKKGKNNKPSKPSLTSITSNDVENVVIPQYASRLGPTKYNRISEALSTGRTGGRRGRLSSDTKSNSGSSKGSKKHRPKGPKKPGKKINDKNKDRSSENVAGPDDVTPEVNNKDNNDDDKDKDMTKEKIAHRESNMSVNSVRKGKKPEGRKDKEDEGLEDDDLNVFESVGQSKKMWLELRRNNLGMFSKTQYEYNVFDVKKHRILGVEPLVGEGENFRATDKPKIFRARKQQDSDNLCEIKYSLGNFFSRAINIEVTMKQERVCVVKQASRTLLVSDISGQVVMRVTDVPTLGCCQQGGPDHFTCHVYLTGGGDSKHVGSIGRNGTRMDKLTLGEPSGVYFVADQKSTRDFRNIHRLYIFSILVVLMTVYAD